MSVFKIFALGLGLVALVESLYVLREQYLSRFAGVDTAWLNLHGSLNAASFVATVMLLCAAVTATLIFHIRRHRMDDYRGRYRMWYPVIGVLAIAAGDVVTHAHRTIQGVAASLMPNAPLGNPASWWILAWVIVGGLLLMRATIDARKCKSVLFFWCLSTVGLLGAAALALDLIRVPSPDAHAMAQAGAFLLGLHFLVFGLVLYARNLFLQAQGARRTARTKVKEVATEDAESPDESATEEKRTGMIRLPGLASWRKRNAANSSDDDEEANSSSKGYSAEELELLTSPDLTSTERRKLKKQMKLRRRQAA